ncbi:MAG: TIGR03545 family protein [Gammaproteobacteria bacterium]|nr:TIGR03545 family protein [Gammaproteobacteria bacterium]
MSIIRVKGLLGLVTVTVLVVSSLFLFSGTIVKSILQSQLSSANGAEVNIDRVEVGYWPFNIVVIGIQVTDRDQPELNLVAIEQASLEISTNSLLKGLFVANDLRLDEIVFSTQRGTPGEIYAEAEKKAKQTAPVDQKSDTGLASTSFELPDINELMNKADLKTEAAFTAVDNQATLTKQNWIEIQTWLDDKKKWKAYETRYKELEKTIKKGSLKEKVKALKDLKQLRKEVKAEVKQFKQYQKKIKADIKSLDETYKHAKKAPAKDWEKLKSSYSIDTGNIGNISRLLFDDDIASYLVLANKYYKKIEPYIEEETKDVPVERDRGRIIRFEDFDPEPAFLIKKAAFTTVLPSGMFEGEARNIGFEQHINQKPATIKLKAKQLNHSKAENISMLFDFRKKNQSVIEFFYDIKQRKIEQYKIASGKTLPLVMESALLDFEINAALINTKLNASIRSQFKEVAFSSQRKTTEKNMASMIAAAMLEVDHFDINAGITGTIKQPKLKIQSDLDTILNKHLKARFEQVKRDYELELKKKLNEKYADKIKKVEKSLSELNKYKQVLEKKQNELGKNLKKYK